MFNERPIVQNQIGLIAFLAGGLSREYFLEGIFGCLQGDHEDETGDKCYVWLSQNIRVGTNQ